MTVPTNQPPQQVTTEALALDRAANCAHLGQADIEQVINALPDSTALWVHVDLVRAQRHLRAAAHLVDTAACVLYADVVSAVEKVAAQ
jgi:hypothetical protein